MLDIRQETFLADYLVICSAESQRQIQAICDEIESTLQKSGIHLYHREGNLDSGWILLDYSSVIVHVFAPSERTYYNLEQLWSRGTPVVRIL